MPRFLPIEEELDYVDRLISPHTFYRTETMQDKVRVAGEIANRSPQQVLLLSGASLASPAVVAGLKPEYIEFIVRRGDLLQKSDFWNLLDDGRALEEFRKIVKKLDLDTSEKSHTYRDRAEEIIWYLRDVAPAIRNDRR